jgi:transposase
VKSPCRYEPEVNRSYNDLAIHYHAAVLAARKRKPRDKPKAEVCVQVAERCVIAPLRDARLVGLAGLNGALWQRMELVHDRPMRHLGKSRRQLFEELDRPALQPLPPTRFEVGVWKAAKVGIDYHFEFDHHFYSVPHELIHEAVEIRATPTVVEVYRRGVRIDAYCRSYVRGAHTTRPEHMPESHRRYLEWTPERLLRWAAEVGPNTARLAQAVMESRDHPQQGFRSCLGIMRLSKDHPTERMEAAAQRALQHGVYSYKGLKRILASGLDGLPAEEEPPPPAARSQENLRGSAYYAKRGESEPC